VGNEGVERDGQQDEQRSRVGVGGVAEEDAAESRADHPVHEVEDDGDAQERPRPPVERDR
jgi:hypothetical protein